MKKAVRLFVIAALSLLYVTQAYAGVTSIKSWQNFSGADVTFSNRENGGSVVVPSNSRADSPNWWVPWVWSQGDVDQKAIEVRAGDTVIGCVFQGVNSDGQDLVRFSRGCNFQITDSSISVNGQIEVVVYEDKGSFHLYFTR